MLRWPALVYLGGSLALGCAGCSASKIKTHPVAGKVELSGGDVALLKGSSIELMQDADPTIRASGPLDNAGRFQVKTFHSGEFVSGAPAGTSG